MEYTRKNTRSTKRNTRRSIIRKRRQGRHRLLQSPSLNLKSSWVDRSWAPRGMVRYLTRGKFSSRWAGFLENRE